MTLDPDVTIAGETRALLVFFSRAGENYHYGNRRMLDVGNTQVLAQMISDRIDCDTSPIAAADPYPNAYDPTVARNVEEERDDARPAIASMLPDATGYDIVLLGSPVWNMRAPMIMSTFIESVDLTGMTILPFVTYAVSGMSGIDHDYREALPRSTVRAGLAVQGETVAQAGPSVDAWLRRNGLL
jgi:flavodoxin